MVAAVSLQGEVRLEGGEIEVRHGAQQRKHRSECTYWRDTEATSAHCVRFCPPCLFPPPPPECGFARACTCGQHLAGMIVLPHRARKLPSRTNLHTRTPHHRPSSGATHACTRARAQRICTHARSISAPAQGPRTHARTHHTHTHTHTTKTHRHTRQAARQMRASSRRQRAHTHVPAMICSTSNCTTADPTACTTLATSMLRRSSDQVPVITGPGLSPHGPFKIPERKTHRFPGFQFRS